MQYSVCLVVLYIIREIVRFDFVASTTKSNKLHNCLLLRILVLCECLFVCAVI